MDLFVISGMLWIYLEAWNSPSSPEPGIATLLTSTLWRYEGCWRALRFPSLALSAHQVLNSFSLCPERKQLLATHRPETDNCNHGYGYAVSRKLPPT